MLASFPSINAFDALAERAKIEASKSRRWKPAHLVETRNLVREGNGALVARWMTAGIGESPEPAAAVLTAAFDFVAATIDALTPSEADPVLYAIRAAQPDRESSLSKKAAMEMYGIVSSEPEHDVSVGVTAAFWMRKICDALASLDPQLIRRCPCCCKDRLFYARRRDQKACPKHAQLLRSTRWLRTDKGRKHYRALLKNPQRSRVLCQPELKREPRRKRKR